VSVSGISVVVKRHPVLAGFVLMFAFTWPIDLWAAADSRGLVSVHVPAILPLLVGYGFVLAALAATGLTSGWAGVRALLGRFLVWRVGLPWYAVVLLGAAVLDLAAIGIYVVLGGATPDFEQSIGRRILGPSMDLWLAISIFFVFGVFTNGEEIGWRGYALPKLQARHGALIASVIVGVVWAVWHLPKFLTAGSAQDFPFPVFLLDTVAKAILYTWVYNSTKGSLLTVTLFHAAANTSAVFLLIHPGASGDAWLQLIAIGLRCLAALTVVVVTGPARLSRAATEPTAEPTGRGLLPAHPRPAAATD
jgi:membrane protease YdiL (CAAX protease family)